MGLVPIGKGSLEELNAYVKSETGPLDPGHTERRARGLAVNWNASGTGRGLTEME